MAYDEFTAIMVKKNTELEAQLATVTAERDFQAKRIGALRRYLCKTITKRRAAEKELAQTGAEQDEFKSLNEHHKAQFLKTNGELSQMLQERDEFEHRLRETCMAYGTDLIKIHDLERELAQAREVIAVCNKENLSDAVMNAIIENTQLKQQLHAAQQREERYKLALLDFLRTYAPEEFTDEQVGESHKRIRDHGGTLAYIAGLLHDKETQP